MGLGKSIEEKEIERKLEERKALSKIERRIVELEESGKRQINNIKEADRDGLIEQAKLARATYKMTLGERGRTIGMYIEMQSFINLRAMAVSTENFVKTMSALSKEIAANSPTKVNKVIREIQKAMYKVTEQTEAVMAVLDENQSNFSFLSDSIAVNITDEEIERRVYGTSNNELNDAALDEKLARLRQEINNSDK